MIIRAIYMHYSVIDWTYSKIHGNSPGFKN